MIDAQGLEVTTDAAEAIAAINASARILFRKKDGADKILPAMADRHLDCPLLQLYAATFFFIPFSTSIIHEKFPLYLARIEPERLNDRERSHYLALQALQNIDFYTAITHYQAILRTYPKDSVALFMLETTCFMAGEMAPLLELYSLVHPYYARDPDFLGMLAFLYAHIQRTPEAQEIIQDALGLEPHNAWVQHVYAHTLSEDIPAQIDQAISFLETCADDWPRQNRFFQGHNWMHLCGLYIKQKKDISSVLEAYSKNIWGEARTFNFEQNNAFLTLWNIELAGHKSAIPHELWTDLAQHAEPFMHDYFTPYLTVTSIMSVTKVDTAKAEAAVEAFEAFASSLPPDSKKYHAWHNVGLPVLKGCLAYIKGKNEEAVALLTPHHDKTESMGHSGEQRSIFGGILRSAAKLLASS